MSGWGSNWRAARPTIPGAARLALLGFSGVSAVVIIASEFKKSEAQNLIELKKARLSMVAPF